MPSIFVLGGTGYIGGAFLPLLLTAYPTSSFTNKITLLTRTRSHIPILTSLGIQPVLGSFSDVDLIEQISEKSDIVINAGSSDDLGMVKAILRGLNKGGSLREGGLKGVFLHVSGAANFLDGGRDGRYSKGRVWDDASEQDIRDINTNMIHGIVDTTILRAGESSNVRTYIVCPCGVNGISSSIKSIRGLESIVRKDSAMHRALVGNALELGYVPSVGVGDNIFSSVHIDDVSQLLLIILRLSLSPSNTSHTPKANQKFNPYTNYYIAKGSSFEWRDVNRKLARVLHERGRITSNVPRNVTLEGGNGGAGWMGHYIASNLHVASTRSLSLGWVPRRDEDEGLGFERTLEGDVDRVLDVIG